VIKARFGDRLDGWLEAALPFLFQRPVNPNLLTVIGTLVSVGAGAAFAFGYFGWGAVMILVGGVFDLVDGVIARHHKIATAFGAFLDSTLDRVEEGIVLTAVAYRFALTGDEFAAAMCVVVVLGSLMVSYTRARAEALGVECKVGVATRPVRVVILSIGLVFAKGAGVFDIELLAPAIYAMAVLTAFTVVQRVWHVRNALKAMDGTDQAPTGATSAPADV
jgi:CDP-diacylglycerol--glycerol-3-phosphate 3-phosphatidyltransferase